MAIPSGSGTEVLKRTTIMSGAAAWTEVNWSLAQTASGNTSSSTVSTDHILTILNVIVTNEDTDSRIINIAWEQSGQTDIRLISNQTVESYQTFVFSEKVILHPTDVFKVYHTDDNVAFYINYIDQDWS